MLHLLSKIVQDIVIAVVFILPILFTIRYARIYCVQFSKIGLLLCLAGPLTTIAFMCGHLFGVIFLSTIEIYNKTRTYDFQTYSLLLMGIVFLGISFYILQQIKGYCKGETFRTNSFYTGNIYLNLLCFPALPLNEGFVFIMGASVLSCAAFHFIVKAETKRTLIPKAKAYQVTEVV